MINAALYAYTSLSVTYLLIIPLMLMLTLIYLCAKIVKGMIRSLKK